MSATPRPDGDRPGSGRRALTLPDLQAMRDQGRPIVMVTAHDYPSAQVAEESGADVVLVGDSAAMNVLGYDSTVPVSVDEMLVLARAVRRGLRAPLLIGDLPFGSYERSDDQAIQTAVRFVKEAGCAGVKLEGGVRSAERAAAMVAAGVPVMGHVGLTPQTAIALGGFKAQGRTAAAARRLLDDALAIQDAGCFSIVFEAIPAQVAELIMEHMRVPVIGIGAGPATDGQVLVIHDMLGMQTEFLPKLAKRYANVREAMLDGLKAFGAEVRDGRFPAPEHSYSIPEDELEQLRGVSSPT